MPRRRPSSGTRSSRSKKPRKTSSARSYPKSPKCESGCGSGDKRVKGASARTKESGRNSEVKQIGERIIKSPLDTHGYKMVQLKENGLKGLLVSTCIHPLESPNACPFKRIREFNKTHANFDTRSPKPPAETQSNVKFVKATKVQKKFIRKNRERRLEKKLRRNASAQVKCKKGHHELDDEMETFCNTKCLVVLYIKAGFFNDPQDIPGMAHFCEHAISLGSKNFPEVEAFCKFVEAHNGFSNAFTEEERTVYYFYVDHEEIGNALEMFVDMFANPIFTSDDNISREVDNLNSEFESKKWMDELKFKALIKSCSVDGHPAGGFGMGSKDTLKRKDLTKRLLQWINENYCTENMMLAIQAPMSLEELEGLIGKFCCRFPPKCRPVYKCVLGKSKGRGSAGTCTSKIWSKRDGPPFQMKKWHRLYHVVGLSHYVIINWNLDPKYGKNYKSKPISYVAYILNRKGKGTLYEYLMDKGWINWLFVNLPDTFYATEYYTLFSIHASLTDLGLEQRMCVLKTIFQYLLIIDKQGPSQIIFDEMRQLQADVFHYRSDMNLTDPNIGRRFDEQGPLDTLFSLLHTLVKTEAFDKVLLNTFLTTEYDPNIIKEFTKSLTIQTAMVLFVSPNFQNKTKKQEKWYKTPYFDTPICTEFISDVEKGQRPKGLQLPGENPFLQVSLCYPEESSSGDKRKSVSDLIIYESKKGSVVYENQTCKKGLLPSSRYTIEFLSSVLEDDLDMFSPPSNDLLFDTIKQVVDERLSEALSSLISVEYEPETGGICIILSGPSPKLPTLAKLVLSTLHEFDKHLERRPGLVVDVKKTLLNTYSGFLFNVEDCGDKILDYVLSRRSAFISDYIKVLEDYSLEDFKLLVEDFKDGIRIDSDLTGCVTHKQASEVASFIDCDIHFPPYKKNRIYRRDNTIHLPPGERCLHLQALRKNDGVVCVVNYYQVGVIRDWNEMQMLHAISDFLHETAFEELRTRNSLGYQVDSSLIDHAGVQGVIVKIIGTADKHSAGYLNEMIDQFMITSFNKCFDSPSNFKKNLVPLLINEDGVTFKCKEVQSFYKKHFPWDDEDCQINMDMRKLSIQIEGEKQDPNAKPAQPTRVKEKVEKFQSGVKLKPCGSCDGDQGSCGLSRYSKSLPLCSKDVEEENGYFITDVQKFKNGLSCYEYPEDDDDDDEDD